MTDTAMERALQLDPKRSPEGGPIWNVHYQIVKNLMEPKLHGLLNFPSHVIMLGHWKIETDQKTGTILSIDPLLTGQLSSKVPGYFDEVYAFFSRIREGKDFFYFRTVSQNLYKARSTISGPYRLLPDEIPNDYPSFKKYLDEAMVRETEIRRKKDVRESEQRGGVKCRNPLFKMPGRVLLGNLACVGQPIEVSFFYPD